MNAYGRLEIATDITRRKQMELELQEAHQQARAGAGSAPARTDPASGFMAAW